jgi:hypothetical protein
MKKVVIGILLASFVGLWACQKDILNDSTLGLLETIANDTSSDPVGTTDLPNSIVSYVNENYSPLEIEMVFMSDDNGYHVILEDGQELFFNMNGDFLGDGNEGQGNGGNHGGGHMGNGPHSNGNPGAGCAANCIAGDTLDTAELPQAVLDYVAENYAGLSINVAVLKPSGKFGVELSDGTVLLFDEDGSFIKVCEGDEGMHGGGHHGMGNHGGNHGPGQGGETNMCTFGDTLTLADLPQSATDYVAENYPGESIEVVVAKPNGDFAVELSSGTVLIFDEDGTFEHECGNHGGHGPGWGGTEITASELPAAAITYIESNYPGETVVLAILTFHEKYFVELSNEVKIIFDTDGNVIFDSGN